MQSKKSREREILLKLSLVLEQCDPDTMQHCLRVGTYARILLEEYIKKYNPSLEYSPLILQWAATLHDIGKSKIPLKIIMKPAKLTAEEFTILRKHTALGEQIVEEYFDSSNRVMMKCAHDAILYHHERYDGKGYPYQFKGDEIPLSAQITGLADCYDALTSARSYKPSFPAQQAYNMIMNGECGNFSDQVLSCLPVILQKNSKIN